LSAKNEKDMLFYDDIWLSFSRMGFISFNNVQELLFIKSKTLERGIYRVTRKRFSRAEWNEIALGSLKMQNAF
jgi:hypothetical protein